MLWCVSVALLRRLLVLEFDEAQVLMGWALSSANMQIRRTFSENDATSYAAASELYRWDAPPSLQASTDESGGAGEEHAHWKLFQRLGAQFRSVVSSSATADAHHIFCGPSCPPLSADNLTRAVAHLRGASAMTHFSHEGGDYLAIAQSFDVDCQGMGGGGGDTCEGLVAQPQSAVLQFNRETQLFGEMLTGTRGMVEQALRIDIGRAARLVWMHGYLLAASLSRGALIYQWGFDESEVLSNVVSVLLAPGPQGSSTHIIAASRGRGSTGGGGGMAVFEITANYDDLGNQARSCRGGANCLRLVEVILEKVLLPKPLAPRHQQALVVVPHGLSAVADVKLGSLLSHSTPGPKCGTGSECWIQVCPRCSICFRYVCILGVCVGYRYALLLLLYVCWVCVLGMCVGYVCRMKICPALAAGCACTSMHVVSRETSILGYCMFICRALKPLQVSSQIRRNEMPCGSIPLPSTSRAASMADEAMWQVMLSLFTHTTPYLDDNIPPPTLTPLP